MNFFKRHRYVAIGLLLMVLVGGLVFLYFNKPGESKLLPPCIFKLITGLYCPGCGSARALYSCLHLDFVTAIRCNALLCVFAPFLLYIFLSWAIKFVTDGKINLPLNLQSKGLVITLLVIVVAFGVMRNIPIEPFCFLAPINLT